MAYRGRRVGGYRRTYYRRTYYRRPRTYYGYRGSRAKNEALLLLSIFRLIAKIIRTIKNLFLRSVSKIQEIYKFALKKYNDKHYGDKTLDTTNKNLSKSPLSTISDLKKEFEEQTSTANAFSSSWEEEGDSILKGFYFSKDREDEWKAFKSKKT